MATKRRRVYLYLALTCFFIFMLTFFVDGYLGIYDTLSITAGEREQRTELFQWSRSGGAGTGAAQWGEKAFFRYEISNRQFSTYSADAEVSLWHDEKMVRSLVSQHTQIAPFGKGKLEWILDTLELLPSSDVPPPSQAYDKYSILIKSGEVERKLKFYIVTPARPRT